jgi:hypothetical protein
LIEGLAERQKAAGREVFYIQVSSLGILPWLPDDGTLTHTVLFAVNRPRGHRTSATTPSPNSICTPRAACSPTRKKSTITCWSARQQSRTPSEPAT